MKKAILQSIFVIMLTTIAINSFAQDTILSNQVTTETKIPVSHVLKGTILNIAKNELLQGANVVIKGTTLGATTDEKGYFEITVDDTVTNKT
ncbi:MAG: carboxypeptidase-like regulatory domain-containing protein, partial [Chitinophagales bacterium]|nr:carboxypeptidase-like regulatory domain-containing protein [Chitinophagales bacterium]